MRTPMIKKGPSFGDWLRATRTQKNLTMPAIAQKAGISIGTLTPIESRGYARPTPPILAGIASALEYPLLAAMIVGGRFDADVIDRAAESVSATIAAAPKGSHWWGQLAAAYMSAVRGAHGVSVADAAERWTARWPDAPLSPDGWQEVENRLTVSGIWRWGVLNAIIPDGDGDEDKVERDLIGIFFLLGQLPRRACHNLGVDRDYQKLDATFRAAQQVAQFAPDGPFIEKFRELLREIEWTVPEVPVPERERERRGDDEEEKLLIARYRLLSPEQRTAVNEILRGMIRR